MTGVAFQSLAGAENMGFIIPVPIIKHFLQDLEKNGKYTGFGGIGIQCQTLENKQLRKFLKLPTGTVRKKLTFPPPPQHLSSPSVLTEFLNYRLGF